MKITNNYTYNPNFGYDKKLNEELKTALKAHPDRKWANMLSSLNNQCNFIEDELIRCEKAKVYNEGLFNNYCDILVELKTMLADHVACTFESLNYPDREARHYDRAFQRWGKKSDDWRLQIMDSISWLANKPPESFQKKEDAIYNKTQPQNATSKDSTPPSSVNKSQTVAKKSSLLTEYTPTEHSPQGFEDVAGMDDVKKELKRGLIQAIVNPEQAKQDYEEYGKKIPRGMLFYGPPGCGKTFITQALAQEAKIPMFSLNISKAGSSYINMTSKNIQDAFDEVIAIAQKEGKPCILFMDEIDTLAFNRTEDTHTEDIKQVGTLLQSMDKAESANIFMIGATNKYKLIDPAIKRRFDSKMAIDVPDKDARTALVKKYLASVKKGEALLADEEGIEKISTTLDGYSNDSICKISKAAGLLALERNRDNITVEDFIQAEKETSEEKPDRNEFLEKDNKSKKPIGFAN